MHPPDVLWVERCLETSWMTHSVYKVFTGLFYFRVLQSR